MGRKTISILALLMGITINVLADDFEKWDVSSDLNFNLWSGYGRSRFSLTYSNYGEEEVWARLSHLFRLNSVSIEPLVAVNTKSDSRYGLRMWWKDFRAYADYDEAHDRLYLRSSYKWLTVTYHEANDFKKYGATVFNRLWGDRVFLENGVTYSENGELVFHSRASVNIDINFPSRKKPKPKKIQWQGE